MRSAQNSTRIDPGYHRAPLHAGSGWSPDAAYRDPCTLVDGVLVVFEGPRRLLWERRSPASWRPVRLWPDDDERAALLARIERNEPVLVVLEQVPCSVPLLEEEAERTPAALVRLLTDESGPAIAVPALDWLPAALRRRGERFARHGRALLAARSALRLGAYLTDRCGGTAAVGFAVPTGGRNRAEAEAAVASWA